MDKIDQLFIRACKSRSPEQRVRSVHKRFFFSCGEDNKTIITRLSSIYDAYCRVDTIKLLADISPVNFIWKYNKGYYDFEEACITALIQYIRLCKRECFPDLIPPKRFR